MKDKVNIGIVGAGFVSQVAHMDNYAQLDNCRILGLAELRPKLRKLAADYYGIERVYQSHDELIDDPDIDAVVAVAPRPLTGPIALDCLKKGKHLITEKPMAATVEQAENLVQAARENELIYAVGYMRRYDEGIKKAKELIEQFIRTKELGPITYVRMHCFMGDSYCRSKANVVTDEEIPQGRPQWPAAPGWVRDNKKNNYAWFVNVYCHNMNLFRFLLNITPKVSFVKFDDHNGQIVVFDFGEFRAVLEGGDFTYNGWDEVMEIYFKYGRMRIDMPPAFLKNVSARVEVYQGNKSPNMYTLDVSPNWSFKNQAQSFIDCVASKKESPASGEDALADMQLIEEIWRWENETYYE